MKAMATEQLYQYVGTITQSEEPAVKAGQAQRTRFHITAPDGNSQWFTAFPDVSRVMQSQPQAQWSLAYTIWTGNNGSESYTIKSATNHGQAAPQAPPPQAQAPVPQAQVIPMAPVPQQPPVQQAPPPQAQYAPNALAWSLNMDNTGRSIIRQVAFKAAEHTLVAQAAWEIRRAETIDDWNAMVAKATDEYEAIILGTYQPSAQPTVDENFIQTEF
jgi:hypothetical protein